VARPRVKEAARPWAGGLKLQRPLARPANATPRTVGAVALGVPIGSVGRSKLMAPRPKEAPPKAAAPAAAAARPSFSSKARLSWAERDALGENRQ
ncbi:unnamed protein product, partial [Polarella glacialis]